MMSFRPYGEQITDEDVKLARRDEIEESSHLSHFAYDLQTCNLCVSRVFHCEISGRCESEPEFSRDKIYAKPRGDATHLSSSWMQMA